jgi:hypothetical protein
MTDPRDCDEVRPLLAELATGAAAGPERARALHHTASCDACRRDLAQLAKAADELLLLAPAHEPPSGFESAVLARFAAEKPTAPTARRTRRTLPHRPWARAVAAAAALLLAAGLAGAAVWQATAADRQLAAEHRQTLRIADGRSLKALPITTETGAHTGTVFLYQGTPSWLLVSLVSAPADGEYRMTVVDRDGVAHPSGACQVDQGAAVEGYYVYESVSDIAEVQLNGPDGIRLTAHA